MVARSVNSSIRRIWVVAPGEKARDWTAFKEGSFIAVLLLRKDLGDLRDYQVADAIADAIAKSYPEEYSSKPRYLNTYAYRFVHEMAVGDYVFARKGRQTILGAGRVVSDYQHNPAQTHFK